MGSRQSTTTLLLRHQHENEEELDSHLSRDGIKNQCFGQNNSHIAQEKYANKKSDRLAEFFGRVISPRSKTLKNPNFYTPSKSLLINPTTSSYKSKDKKTVRFQIAGKLLSPVMSSPFRGLRKGVTSSGNTYPYPRTHTTVMVVPRVGPSQSQWSSASSCDDSPTSSTNVLDSIINNTGAVEVGYTPRPRPPLNRAIPPIPESRSNESIMSQASQVKSVSTNPAGGEVAAPKPEETMGIVVEKEDTSVVIENKMAQNLGAKTASERLGLSGPSQPSTRPTSSSLIAKPKDVRPETRKIQSRSEPPKSPLLSMAHSVRSRLSKLGNRFGRSDSRSPIRTSTSLIMMKREKSSDLASKSGMLKSSSMDEPGTSKIPHPSKTGIPVLRQTGGSLIPSPIGPTAIAAGSPIMPPKSSKMVPQPQAEVTVETKVVKETTVETTKSTIETPNNEATALLISPVSNTTTTSSNTDTIYSGQCSSTTRPLSSLATSDTAESIAKTPTIPETAPEIQVSKIPQPSKLKPPSTVTTNLPKIEPKVETKKSEKKEEPEKKISKISASPKSVASKVTNVLSAKSLRADKTTSKKLPSPKSKQRRAVFGKRYNSVEIEDKAYEPEAKTPRKSASFVDSRAKTNGHKQDSVDEEESNMRFFNKINPFAPSERKKLDLRKIHSVNKNRRAPLAEFESTRVENSPAVEIPPVNFNSRINAMSPRRIISTTVPATGIAPKYLTSPSPTVKRSVVRTIEDANGNLVVLEESEAMTIANTHAQEIPNLSSSLQSNASCLSTSPNLADNTGFDTHRSGLIDDEIGDQPMLISASSYTLIDELDAPILKRRRNSIDSEEATFVADINDNIQNHKRPSGGASTMPASGAISEMVAVEECMARMSVNGEDHEEVEMADCLLLNTLIRTIRTTRASSKSRARSKNDLPTVCATIPSTSEANNKSRSQAYEDTGDYNSQKVYYEQLATYEATKQDLVAMKAQLLALQVNLMELSNAAGDGASTTSADEDEIRHRLDALERENQELRRQLQERDQTIDELKAKLAAQT